MNTGFLVDFLQLHHAVLLMEELSLSSLSDALLHFHFLRHIITGQKSSVFIEKTSGSIEHSEAMEDNYEIV